MMKPRDSLYGKQTAHFLDMAPGSVGSADDYKNVWQPWRTFAKPN